MKYFLFTNFLSSNIRVSLGLIFFIAIEDYCLREKIAPREKWLITFKIHQKETKDKTNISFGKEMMENVHYGIKLYPLKIHATWIILYVEKRMVFHLQNRREITIIQQTEITSKNLLLVIKKYEHQLNCDPRKVSLFHFQLCSH